MFLKISREEKLPSFPPSCSRPDLFDIAQWMYASRACMEIKSIFEFILCSQHAAFRQARPQKYKHAPRHSWESVFTQTDGGEFPMVQLQDYF